MDDIVSVELTEGWTIDARNREAMREGECIALTQRETELLCYLGARAGEFVAKEVLLREVWGYRAVTETRAISNCIRRLRKKLGDDPRNSRVLESKYGGSLRVVAGTVHRASPVSTIYTRDAHRESPVLPVWWPSGSDRPDRWTQNLCGRMEDISVALHHTHIGVEHLIDALARERSAAGPSTLWVSSHLSAYRSRFAIPELSPVDMPDAALIVTPRLLRALKGPGYTIDFEMFASRLLDQGGLAAVLGLDRLPAGGAVRSGGDVVGLEVVGGPEDGRYLLPEPGQTIGRDAPEEAPDVGLYAETALVDRRLSRRHLTWLGPGRIELRRRGTLERTGLERAVGLQEFRLLPGDLLRLGTGTYLRAVTHLEVEGR